MGTNDLIHRLKKLADGKMLILVDDYKQLNETALICLADFTTPQVVNKMVTHARGMLSISMTKSAAEEAGLPLQKSNYNLDQVSRNYTVSIDADETSTGISAQERSLSIKKLAQTRTAAGFKKPGHIFPVIANERGLFGYVSVIEAAMDCAEMIGLKDSMVTICDILNDYGMTGDLSYSLSLAHHLQLPVVYLSEILKDKLIKADFLSSKVRLSMDMDGCPIQIRVYDLFGKYYEVFFAETNISRVYEELAKIRRSLTENAIGSLVDLPYYQSSASGIAVQLKNDQCIVIHGEVESIYCDMVYEMILNDLVNDLNELVKELSITAK